MANGNVLPPQAYTREMLSQAFNWLQNQPEAVRAQATNPENLIAIYIKAQRAGRIANGNQAPDSIEAPVSSQNFLHDLKSLAEGLKQFDQPQPEVAKPLEQNHHRTPPMSAPPPSNVVHQQQTAPPPPQAPNFNQNQAALSMNAKSLLLIREVKEKLGLSSEGEALNMMVTIAYKNLKNLID